MNQIRVLQVIGAMNRAGAETVVMNLMRAIDNDIVHFDFLVHTNKRCDYDDEIESLGGTIYRVPRFNVVNAREYRLACRRLFEEHPEIQVVHGHIGSSSAIYLDEARKAGCATVVHSHRDSPKPTSLKAIARRKAYSFLVRNTASIADEFLACATKAGLDRFGPDVVSGEHFHIMKNSIDADLYACDHAGHIEAKKSLGLGDGPLVGCVARLAPEKNHQFLFDVFSTALPYMPNAKLLVIGQGPLESELRERVEALGITESVMFLGIRNDVPNLLKALDVLVFPSFIEGLPMTIVEAQAAGLPSIVSTAIPEEAIFTNLCQRLSLDEGTNEWAARLIATVEADLPRTDMSSSVRSSGYDIAEVARWMTEFYTDLANRSKRGNVEGEI